MSMQDKRIGHFRLGWLWASEKITFWSYVSNMFSTTSEKGVWLSDLDWK